MIKNNIMAGKLTSIFFFLIVFSCLSADDDPFAILDEIDDTPTSQPIQATFKTTRLILGHTVETLPKRSLDFRVAHRFDDILGDQGGLSNFYGFDRVTDIRIGFEYGITDNLMVGIGRTKGSAQITKNFEGFVKYRILKQMNDNSMPFTVTAMLSSSISTRAPSLVEYSEAAFQKFAHRLSYTSQLIIGRKFGDVMSLQLLPTVIHRNFVRFEDENTLFALGAGARINITRRTAIIIDYFYPFSEYRRENEEFKNPLGIGIEFETGGHVFHLNFSNSKGILESDFIPYTTSSWLDGEFRLGFNISRVFGFGY
ncbi:MAG: hypothetical protein EA412_05580 [Chitinophagaceae bacterium]|nr:MAG: hypothetical protein EA412_05580 [Chitinophagaceae bacterium]